MISRKLVEQKAETYGVPFEILASVIYQESSGYQWATRSEETWYKRFIEHLYRNRLSGYVPSEYKITLSTEKRMRSMSFGYMQILGETARSILQYKGRCLAELYQPELNLNLGCTLLRKHYDKAIADGKTVDTAWDISLKKYNGASIYVKKIREHLASKRYEGIFLP